MDAEASLRDILATTNFGVRPINAIVDFLSENLTDLASMQSKDLDLGIANLHKVIASLATAGRVRLNVSKYITLHSIRLHFHDCIACPDPLDAIDIADLAADDIHAMKADYTE